MNNSDLLDMITFDIVMGINNDNIGNKLDDFITFLTVDSLHLEEKIEIFKQQKELVVPADKYLLKEKEALEEFMVNYIKENYYAHYYYLTSEAIYRGSFEAALFSCDTLYFTGFQYYCSAKEKCVERE